MIISPDKNPAPTNQELEKPEKKEISNFEKWLSYLSLDFIAKKIGVTQSKDIRIERMREILDKYLMPHLGIKKEDRIF